MAKLYFRYGTVSSAKSLNLIAVAYNYKQQNKPVVLVKPALDLRFGQNEVASRAGLSMQADFSLKADEILPTEALQGKYCVLVEEAQFLSKKTIDSFREIADVQAVPVICYGLRTDFRTKLFSGSKRLLELADAIEEVKTTCYFCNGKAIYNLKLLDGKATLQGPKVELGFEETYLPSCAPCYFKKLLEADL